MNSIYIVVITTLILCEFIFFQMLLASKKEIKKKENQLGEMGKKINQLREKINENRRKAFRVDIPNEDCMITFLDFGEKALESLLNRVGTGHIQDISVQGLKFTCEFDLPLKKDVTLGIQFHLGDEPFDLKGKLVRKEAHVQSSHVTYGMEFEEVDSCQQERLNLILNRIQLERRRKAV